MARQNGSKNSRAALATIQKLESLERAGVEQLGKPRGRKGALAQTSPPAARPEPIAPAEPIAAAAAMVEAPGLAYPATLKTQAGADSLELIRQEVAACRRCEELACTRTQTVFGVGNPNARLCFLGEAPGADEDRQGEPFVGRAGQLLTRIIEACTLSRADVYILNVLKCRPPGNRQPLPDEVANCRGFLDRQLALIRPEYLCCLGAVAAQTLLETHVPIGRLRGKFFDYQGISVTCTYHPAYLLRNPAAKKEVWEDMKALMRKLGIELDNPPAR
jgi:DNA polymerase